MNGELDNIPWKDGVACGLKHDDIVFQGEAIKGQNFIVIARDFGSLEKALSQLDKKLKWSPMAFKNVRIEEREP